jgi:allophanate hydrolase
MTLLAVVGAHLSGQPLNHQLTDRDAALVRTTATAPVYRFHALDTEPPKPGLVRVASDDGGAGSIEVEVWELDDAGFGSFVALVPPPLCIGTVELLDGTQVKGFLCEPHALVDAPDITATGGWRAYLG